MNTDNTRYHGEIRKILCGYPLSFVVMHADSDYTCSIFLSPLSQSTCL